MNRAERRRQEKAKSKADKSFMMKQSELDELYADAVDTSLALLLCLPIFVLKDNFGKLMKKEGRLELFTELLLDYYEQYINGDFTLEEMQQFLLDETGIQFKKGGKDIV